jgi:hypothetical protein
MQMGWYNNILSPSKKLIHFITEENTIKATIVTFNMYINFKIYI